jgi:hypothetical protein
MTERTTVRLPDELIRRAKRKAVDEGRSLTSLIEEGLRRVLDDQIRTAKARKVLPPVSAATGGLQPGIDLNNSAALQESDDIDYAKRFL